MKILLAGDTHADLFWWDHLIAAAKQFECELIFQLGDFGYFENIPVYREYLDELSVMLREADIDAYWLDGNHDNHPLLWKKHKPKADGFATVRPRLRYAPRGHCWTWDGVKFLAVGGAYSIDRADRTLGKSWWAEELTTDEDVVKACSHGFVDVLLSHDAPMGVNIPNIIPDIALANENRERLREVVVNTLPSVVAHGHYHRRYTDLIDIPLGAVKPADELGAYTRMAWHRVRVEGYHCNFAGDSRAYGILDTENIRRLVASSDRRFFTPS